MTQFWSLNHICQVSKLKTLLDMSNILNNIYSDRCLLVALINIFDHRSAVMNWELPFGRLWKLLILKKNTFKTILYLFIFYPKTSNLYKSGMFGHRKLPDLSLNKFFGVLLIRSEYTLWFQWPDFCLKCHVIIMPKGQPLIFKASVLYEIWQEF